jgi:hypothetical protein
MRSSFASSRIYWRSRVVSEVEGGVGVESVRPSDRWQVRFSYVLVCPVGGGEPEARDGLVVVPKLEPAPGFPRRVGIAKKRPLR